MEKSDAEYKNCEARVNQHLAARIADIRKMWKTYPEAPSDDLPALDEYGLCFDYCPAGTWNDQVESFFRWQLSTGGPGDEFRFYAGLDWKSYKIEYVFIDWYDGASRRLHGARYNLLAEIWSDFFVECGAAQAEFDKAKGP